MPWVRGDPANLARPGGKQDQSQTRILLSNLLNEISSHDFEFEQRSDPTPIMKLRKTDFEAKGEALMANHPMFILISLPSIIILQRLCVLLKIKQGQVLFRQGESSFDRFYIIIAGKIELRGAPPYGDGEASTIGAVGAGDTFGEEGIYEAGPSRRKDSAYAEEDTYVMEFSKDILVKAKDMMQLEGLGIDWFTLNNHIKK